MRLTPGSLVALLIIGTASGASAAEPQVTVQGGVIEGRQVGDIQTFLGIPFAAPPVGALRWQPPQPVTPWVGVRPAKEFGARAMQAAIWKDMIFRDRGGSEDCLTLNVWAPTPKAGTRLPVMVWIYGGGFNAGGTSEPRQDGTHLAQQGVIVVSMNYRLGVFGFLVHPDLAKESPKHASGNYGLMDQQAALRWVRDNIAQFGGDPSNVTIFGESAGAFSVAEQMAAPGDKGLFKQAIGESGGVPLSATLREETFAQRIQEDPAILAKLTGANSLAALRAVPAETLIQALAGSDQATLFHFVPTIDGDFISEASSQIYAHGHQNDVPLLAGWNHDERTLPPPAGVTAVDHLKQLAADRFGKNAAEFLKVFPGDTEDQAVRSATAFANAGFVSFNAWEWMELQTKTGHSPVYRYSFDRAPPTDFFGVPRGSYHSAEINYVFGTLDSQVKTPWQPEDRQVAKLVQAYWLNFAKTGNPNGPGLPEWPAYGEATGWSVMRLAPTSQAQPDEYRAGYLFLGYQQRFVN